MCELLTGQLNSVIQAMLKLHFPTAFLTVDAEAGSI